MSWLDKELESRRISAIKSLKSGATQLDVMDQYHVSRVSVWRWVRRDRQGKLGAQPRPRKGCRLSSQQRAKLVQEYGKGPGRYGAEIWTYELAARLIKDMFSITYHKDHVGKILRRLGLVETKRYRSWM